MTGPTAHVDLAAIGDNISSLAARAPHSAFLLAVKSDAYGHGMLPVVEVARDAGASWFGTLDTDTGFALREAGVREPLFAWVHGRATDFAAAAEAQIDLGIQTMAQLEAVGASAARTTPRVHLKIDTGLHRGGIDVPQWDAFVRRALELQAAGRLQVVAAWSHLSDTSTEVDRSSAADFLAAVDHARALGADFELLHLGASTALIELPEAHLDLVRVGIAAYGISPVHESARELGLRPAMRLTAPVLESVGPTAVLAVGYGDGIQSEPSDDAFVALAGGRARVLDVGPDVTTVDASGLDAHVGDTAVVFGPGDDGEADAEQWAIWGGTVGDEIVTGLTRRVARTWSGRQSL